MSIEIIDLLDKVQYKSIKRFNHIINNTNLNDEQKILIAILFIINKKSINNTNLNNE